MFIQYEGDSTFNLLYKYIFEKWKLSTRLLYASVVHLMTTIHHKRLSIFIFSVILSMQEKSHIIFLLSLSLPLCRSALYLVNVNIISFVDSSFYRFVLMPWDVHLWTVVSHISEFGDTGSLAEDVHLQWPMIASHGFRCRVSCRRSDVSTEGYVILVVSHCSLWNNEFFSFE